MHADALVSPPPPGLRPGDRSGRALSHAGGITGASSRTRGDSTACSPRRGSRLPWVSTARPAQREQGRDVGGGEGYFKTRFRAPRCARLPAGRAGIPAKLLLTTATPATRGVLG